MAYTAKREELIAGANALFDLVARGIVKSDITRRWPLLRQVQAPTRH